MITVDNIQRVYLLGIGGIGMSALARWYAGKGLPVAGYDRTPSPLTAELETEGMQVIFDDEVQSIPLGFLDPATTLVILTPAVPKDHPQLLYFRQNGYKVLKRSEVLGHISRQYTTLAVAGTHGKTTTSSILAHLLHGSSKGCNAFLGGIAANFNSNLVVNTASHLMVAEADEYDRSFLQLSPALTVLTSVDPDHLDIYGTPEEMRATYREFVGRLGADGMLIKRQGLDLEHTNCMTYAVDGAMADHHADNLRPVDGLYSFDLITPKGKIEGLRFGMPGRHNLENAIGAASAALHVGISADELRQGLATFRGAKRRFEAIIRTERLLFIDDYAHHPAELSACIRSVRELNPGRHVTGVFQPHLFSRTRDLAEGFAQSLAELDRLILLPIYPARELPMPGITSEWLLEMVPMTDKRMAHRDELPALLRGMSGLQVLLTLGAGDIDRAVKPISEALKS
jgi:UDP-N-acetylmuramate--alanine ligase